jgi:hypothetical protein
MVFIKMEIVSLLKFRSELNGTSHYHQSNCFSCPIIKFYFCFFLKKKKDRKMKKKNLCIINNMNRLFRDEKSQ